MFFCYKPTLLTVADCVIGSKLPSVTSVGDGSPKFVAVVPKINL
jgi:hypothetical protein